MKAKHAVMAALAATFSLSGVARAESVTVPQGTPVILVFDGPLSSKTAREGQPVWFHVRDAVMVNNATVVPAGAKVSGVITKVDKRKRFGVNANLRIALNPLPSAFGQPLPLEARSTAKEVGGKKTDKAAAATAGGAVVLGPVGLVGGYFVHGKPVNIKTGDTFETDVAQTITLTR